MSLTANVGAGAPVPLVDAGYNAKQGNVERPMHGMELTSNPPTPVSRCRIRSEWTVGRSGMAFLPHQSSDQTHLTMDEACETCEAPRLPAAVGKGAVGQVCVQMDRRDMSTCPAGVTTYLAGMMKDATTGAGNATGEPLAPLFADQGEKAHEPQQDHGARTASGVELVP